MVSVPTIALIKSVQEELRQGKELRRKRGDDGGGTRVRVLSLGAHAGME